jgi:hypothetical protein
MKLGIQVMMELVEKGVVTPDLSADAVVATEHRRPHRGRVRVSDAQSLVDRSVDHPRIASFLRKWSCG